MGRAAVPTLGGRKNRFYGRSCATNVPVLRAIAKAMGPCRRVHSGSMAKIAWRSCAAPNWIANWLAAILQVSGGFVHRLVMLRKAR